MFLTSTIAFPRLWVFFFSFHQAWMMVIMSGLESDWMVMIWDGVRQMRAFVDCFRGCKFLRCQRNSVLLWWRGRWRMENLCRNRKCVRFSHGEPVQAETKYWWTTHFYCWSLGSWHISCMSAALTQEKLPQIVYPKREFLFHFLFFPPNVHIHSHTQTWGHTVKVWFHTAAIG